MSWFVPLLLVVIIGVPLVIVFARMGELFVLRLRDGRMRVVRGRIPQRLLDEVADVMRRAGVDNALLRGELSEGRARIRASGTELSPEAQQRLRNVLGQWPVAKIRNAPPRR